MLLCGDPLDEYAVRCRSETLFYSIEDLRNAVLSVEPQVPRRRFKRGRKPGNFDSFMLPLCKELTRSPLEVVDGVAEVSDQDPCRAKKRVRKPPGAYPVAGIMMVRIAVLSIGTERVVDFSERSDYLARKVQ